MDLTELQDSSTEQLVVVYAEDDERLAHLTTQYLRSHDILVHRASRGDEVVDEVCRVNPDLILLDLMLPGADGLVLCRRLRERLDTPIIMVTARTEEVDRVLGLEVGADDYVIKPFAPRELVARIRAQVRRARGASGPASVQVRVGGLHLDSGTMCASLNGEVLHLTTLEFGLLRVLAERAGRVLSREQLLVLTHGTADGAFDRSIDVHVSRLRQKLESNPRRPRLLKTVRGVGYVLVADAAGE